MQWDFIGLTEVSATPFFKKHRTKKAVFHYHTLASFGYNKSKSRISFHFSLFFSDLFLPSRWEGRDKVFSESGPELLWWQGEPTARGPEEPDDVMSANSTRQMSTQVPQHTWAAGQQHPTNPPSTGPATHRLTSIHLSSMWSSWLLKLGSCQLLKTCLGRGHAKSAGNQRRWRSAFWNSLASASFASENGCEKTSCGDIHPLCTWTAR